MPRLKSVTDANGTKIYPVTITRGVYDTDKNQRLDVTLANKADNTIMGASGSNHAPGLVPDTPSTAGTTKYLREDGTWQTPPNTTYSEATTSAAGLMSSSDKTKLNGIESGADVTDAENVKAALGTNSTHGGAFLRKDGTWVVPTDDNTTYGLSVGTGDDANKIVLTPSSGTADKITVPYASNAGTVNGKTVAKNVPSDAVFTDTTYESKAAANGGTDVSLVTTGEKYIWNNKQNALTFNTTPSSTNKVATMADIPSSLPANGGTAENVSDTVAIEHGGTGATTASAARTNLGLGSLATKSSLSASDIPTLTPSKVGLSNVTNDAQVKRSEMGVASGVATLDSAGKVPSSQLPSYVDDVIEGYYYNNKFYEEAAHTTLITGESDKIYVDLSTDTTYRCSNVTNQTYTQIKGDLALGETSTTAYRGDRGKTAYDHSQTAHARTDATKVEASTTNGNIKINGTETTVYTLPSSDPYTSARTPSSHSHGNIANGGTLTDTAAAAAGNDYVVIRDASDNKIQTSTIKGTEVADAVSKKHEHSTLTLSTTAQAYDGTHTLALPSSDPYSTARTPSSHTHGNITNAGALQTTDISIADGDKLVVTDASNLNKIARTSVAFDGSTTTTALTPKGTFETFSKFSGSYNDLSNKPAIPSAANDGTFSIKTKVGTNSAVTAADFTANQSSADDITLIQGNNVTLTTDTANRTVTIAATDTTYSEASTSTAGLMSAADKVKLNGIAAGAEVNVQSDWDATDGDAFIKNKPTIPDSFQWFGTSSTAADTVQKEVSIPSITSLKAGQLIIVLPTVTSTVADSTLKLNSFDAYPMRYGNAAITTSTDSIVWSANYPSVFVFDGSYWIFLTHGYDSNNTYSSMSVAEGTTGTSTKARSIAAVNLKQIIQTLAPQSDWNATSGNAVILNKPTIPSEVTESTVSGWGFTKNVGTITGIKMNGASMGTSGVVDLGTVITDISGKVDNTTTVNGHALSGNVSVTKSDVGLENVTNDSQVKRSEMGAASGVATLDSNGKVLSSQLPSYVDDVIEGYFYNSKFYKESEHTTEITGETGKIYVDLSTNKTYRWGGSAYAVISETLALGETSSTAYRGDRGKTAYTHSQTTSGNPHNVTKSDVGLGNVGNFKAVSTVASQDLTDTEKSNARANIGAGTSSFSGSYNDLSNKPTIPAAAANGTYTVKTLVGSTTTNVSDFTANQSSADDVTFVQGSNVTITPDATNRKITIAATDTTYNAGTGVTISGTNNAINVKYGTAADTACQGNDSRLSDSRTASDVYSWAKAENKPSYAYSEIGYTVSTTSSAGGTLSLAGTTPLHVVTLTGNVSALSLSANPAEGHSCHVIFTAASAQTVTITHDSADRVCPRATNVTLSIPADGYVEVDFLCAGGKVFVRGV